MSDPKTEDETQGGFLGNWLQSGLAGLLIFLALAGGAIALLLTPREEEPQIDVPLIDVFVEAPGLTAEEVERRIVWPMEQTLFATSGVEYVYSSSFRDGAILTARFYVGESPVESEVHVRNRLERNSHRYSPELADYQIRPVYVDDVPFMTLTLHSSTVDDARLLSMAEEYLYDLTRLEGVGLIFIVGGRNEAARVELDPQKMAAHGVTMNALEKAVAGANQRVSVGHLISANQSIEVDSGYSMPDIDGLKDLVISQHNGQTVLLGDVASIRLSPLDPEHYLFFSEGRAAAKEGSAEDRIDPDSTERGAVTMALAKRPGVNAVEVSARVRAEVEKLRQIFQAEDVQLSITRDYGQSADHAVNWLVYSLLGASGVVMVVLAASLGLREALIVAVSVPTTFATALLVNYLGDFTLNRVTLFALIVALGLIVDDSIVSIENIHRFLHTEAGGEGSRLDKITAAVREVIPPMVLTSLVVVVAFIPLAFVTGLMGPYMAPMALTVPIAMLASTAVATLIVPWLADIILKDAPQKNTSPENDSGGGFEDSGRYRFYHAVVAPLLDHGSYGFVLIGGLGILFVVAVALPFLQLIPLKLLPFEDAEELQLVIDQKEGATAEDTGALVQELSAVVLQQPEVLDLTAYAGLASPVDFNGLVRGYYLRSGSHVGDIRINLVEDARRASSNHQISLRLREAIQPIAKRYDASVKVVERPPGPPVLSPLVAELTAEPGTPYEALMQAARKVENLFEAAEGVVDVDTSMEAPAERLIYEIDHQKAGQVGLTATEIGGLMRAALTGATLSYLRESDEIRPRPIQIRLPQSSRTDPATLEDLPLTRIDDKVLTLGELGSFRQGVIDQTIERKNLARTVYVTAGVAGLTPTSAAFALEEKVSEMKQNGSLNESIDVRFDGEGEWFITRRVFRDLGVALGVALLAIYAMLVYQTGNYIIPLILLTSVPLTLIGIMPGFWLLNFFFSGETAGFNVGIPFTATGMIGIVALAGIAVRNAILLIDFTQNELKRGEAVRTALLRAGALRMRPILLTAGTAMLAVVPIAFDPVFAGLAWSLIFGLFVSTLFTLVVVPILFNAVYGRSGVTAT